VDGIDERGTQERLLKLWEGPASDTSGGRLQIDVARVLFICGGAFTGLDEVVARSGRHPEQPVTSETLAALGVAPDLVRRVRAIGRVVPLDEETLLRLVPFVDFDRMESGLAELSAAPDRLRD